MTCTYNYYMRYINSMEFQLQFHSKCTWSWNSKSGTPHISCNSTHAVYMHVHMYMYMFTSGVPCLESNKWISRYMYVLVPHLGRRDLHLWNSTCFSHVWCATHGGQWTSGIPEWSSMSRISKAHCPSDVP